MIHPIGTIVRRKFGNHYFEGKIAAYDSKEGFYHVVYLDGDQEDMDDNEVKYTRNLFNNTANGQYGKYRCHLPHPNLQPQRDLQWQLNTLNR